VQLQQLGHTIFAFHSLTDSFKRPLAPNANRRFCDSQNCGDFTPSISEDAGPDMTIDALMSVIAYFRITATRAKEILSDVMHAVNGWRKTGQSIGMSEEELEPFVDAFEHGERAAAKRLI
jgi:hypothetical protein